MKARFLALVLLAAAAGGAMPAYGASSLEPVTLQLNWKHQFQFAGYYAAVEKGFYREAGFDTRLEELQQGSDPVEAVLSGRATFGVGASELALRRGRGDPVVVLAVILQHSPLVMIARADRAASVHDLVGRRIMLAPHEKELFAYFQREGLSAEKLIQIPHSFDVADLTSGRVDAMSGYVTDEPFLLRNSGVRMNLFSPRASGIDFYGDSLFTSEDVLRREPERVAAFVDASLKGWRYALDHQEEIADLIIARFSRRKSRDHLLFEAAELWKLTQPDLVEIGHMHRGRWQHIAETYAGLEMLPASYSIDGLLYERSRKLDRADWLRVGAGFLLIVLAAGALVATLVRLNLRLRREMTSRSKAQEELRASDKRYRLLVESAPLALVVWDRARRVLDWNSQAERIFGWTRREVEGRDFSTFLIPDSARERIEEVVQASFEKGVESRSLNANLTKDGRTLEVEWHNTVLVDADGRPASVLSLAYDVTDRIHAQNALQEANDMLRQQLQEIHELQTELREQVVRDSLTGLYNRRYLDDALQAEVSRAIRSGEPLAVMMLDIDHFKKVNDTYGHQIGDEVLKMLAGLLRRGARRSDVACRYGGEEFVLLLPNMNLESATERAEHWRRAFAETELVVDDRRLQCTLSVGVAVFPEHGDSAEALLRSADRALYLAKALGRNRVVVYDSPPSAGAPSGGA